MDPRAEEGSFADMRKKSTLKPLELLTVLKEELHSMNVVWPFGDEGVKHLKVGYGRYQVQMVGSALYCTAVIDQRSSVPRIFFSGGGFNKFS
jgi:hypothetical protein